MLKRRLIGLVLVRDGTAVQSIGFRKYLPVGTPEIAVEYLDRWGVDEIVLVHIDAWRRGSGPTAQEVERYARLCNVPLTVGGGLRSVDDVRRVIQAGADKVALNSAAFESPSLITQAAEQFGEQCIVVSIDARRDGTATRTFTHGGTRATGMTVADAARHAEHHGAGEVMVTSIDRDGSLAGYDLAMLREAVEAVHIPVIGAGGAGSASHMADAVRTGVAAVAAGNCLHYVEHSVILMKRHLQATGVPIRLDSYANYQSHPVPAEARLTHVDEAYLEGLRFRYIPEEVI